MSYVPYYFYNKYVLCVYYVSNVLFYLYAFYVDFVAKHSKLDIASQRIIAIIGVTAGIGKIANVGKVGTTGKKGDIESIGGMADMAKKKTNRENIARIKLGLGLGLGLYLGFGFVLVLRLA